ncbi:hypothetical protein A4A49_02734 [Nicotiana attenuata]|uniref:PB1 domain-containing protein n=1 Tax=Nicotiana attenuata TaxID=49451 RepID=A0A314L2Y7_NICAT|nr:hypothetical protein A4A49_02734 [Nicotiana attenuata]
MMVSEGGLVYIGGRTEHVFNVNEDHLSIPELADYARSFGITKLEKTFVVPYKGDNLVELKNDMDIYGLSQLLSDGDTIAFIIERGIRESDCLVAPSTVDLNIGVVHDGNVNEDGYSSIDWTDTDEEEVAQDLPIVEHTAQDLAITQQSESIDYESDVHEELRIVKKDVKQFKKLNRRGRKGKKGKCGGYLGEVGLDEGFEDINKEMRSTNGKLLADEPYYDSSDCDSFDCDEESEPVSDDEGPRNKTIVTMLEEIKVKVMIRVSKSREFAETWVDGISSMAMMVFNTNVEKSMQVTIDWNGDEGFEVLEEFAESQQSSTVNPKKRNRGDSGIGNKGKGAKSGYKKPRVVRHGVFVSQSGYTSVNQGLPSSRTVKTPCATVINSAHMTGYIGYQPTKGLKWKGKTTITQRQLQVQSAQHRITTRSRSAGIQTRAQVKGKSLSKIPS